MSTSREPYKPAEQVPGGKERKMLRNLCEEMAKNSKEEYRKNN